MANNAPSGAQLSFAQFGREEPRQSGAIPKDPGAGGFYARYLASKLQGRSINIEPEQKSKEARAAPFASQCEIGMVKLLEGPWNQRFIDELCAFPNGAHDDQVDAATAA